MDGPRIIDISPPLSERLAVYPGDVPFRRRVSQSLSAGDEVELSSIETTVHAGAHADAPSHTGEGAPAIDERPLSLYYGPCQVVAVQVAPAAQVGPRHIPRGVRLVAPRVLFRTGSYPDPERFTEDFAGLSPELVGLAAAEGVRLVGIDTPSVDRIADEDLPVHHAALRHDVALLEGLRLSHVEPGFYTLVALTLRLEGADGSPIRAALLDDGGGQGALNDKG